MCGFFLAFNDSAVDIVGLTESMLHRGPDSTGYYRDERVSAGFNRLAIVDDLEVSNQPMVDDSDNYVLLFNGEIYNHQELREYLRCNYGAVFKTFSDTEVLLYGLIREGEEFASRLDGIFAFAFYDKRRNGLTLGRDQFGVKPLYYAVKGHAIYISSELLPLQKLVNSSLNSLNTIQYLSMGYVTGNLTPFDSICKVEANTTLTYSPGQKMLGRQIREFNCIGHDEDSQENIYSQIFRTIENQKPGIPYGVLFSGGIDSTLVLDRCFQDKNFQGAYSVNVSHQDMSEEKYQNYVVDKNNIRKKTYTLNIEKNDFSLQSIAQAANGLDLPLFHPNFIGSLKISNLARSNGIKVLLSGEGADELFYGYRWLQQEVSPREYLEYVPARELSTLFGVSYEKFPDFDHMKKEEIFQKVYLQRWLLRQDVTGMANSVEIRVPFLGIKFAKYINSLSRKIIPGTRGSKWILKEALRSKYGDEFVDRKKIGFDFPLNDWLNEEHLSFVLEPNPFYDVDVFRLILNQLKGSYLHNRLVFSILSYRLWLSNVKWK
jgi:asparagine synthase (glutamine-hydrolysing)